MMRNSVLSGLQMIDVKRTINLFLIPVLALTGDTIVNNYTFPFWHLLLKSITDSSTHFLIAALSWNYVCISAPKNRSPLVAAFLCGLLASSIDVDHFIASGSISLQAATSLSQRPILHCTTIPTGVAFLVFMLSLRKQSMNLLRFAWLLITAAWTHHWRDGYRRGIWICPIGSTSSYSYYLYLVGLVVLSLALHFGLKYTSELVSKSNISTSTPIHLV